MYLFQWLQGEWSLELEEQGSICCKAGPAQRAMSLAGLAQNMRVSDLVTSDLTFGRIDMLMNQ